jgi:hypothetical protein
MEGPGRGDLGLLWQKPIKDPNKGMFSAIVLAATTLRESVQLVVSLVTVAFAVACIVAVSGFLEQHCNQNRKKKPIEIDKEK